ncbi:MAG: hypothetical protein HY273_01485 [Gammaproteobacteria bacterium]|nr:hypothetical protein [Gammaproteobacteria bacterium]
MKLNHAKLAFMRISVVIFWIGFAAGCSSLHELKPTSILQSNIEQDRFTPNQATNKALVLDAYQHHLSAPVDAPLAVHAMSQFDFFLREGGTGMVQVGVSTLPPTIGVSHVHVLMVLPRRDDAGDAAVKINSLVDAAAVMQRRLPAGSTVTFDAGTLPSSIKLPFATLKPEMKGDNLEAILKEYLFVPLENGKHHFILLVGEHGKLTAAQQQNVVDMAEVMVSHGAGVSVLAMGEKPDVAFLAKLSSTGDGVYDLFNQEFSLTQWLSDVIVNMHATRYTDLSLTINFAPRLTLGTKWISDKYVTRDRQIVVTVPELKQGREKVYLVEVNVPPETDNSTAALVSVSARYRDTAADKILTAQASKALVYTLDPNLALTKPNKAVQRSLAILKTADVIDEVATTLRDKRPFKGVALLSKQAQDLRALATPAKDEELLRDARILDAYAQRLVSFTDESFQSLKLYRDLSWDTARYREAPK